MALQFKRLPGRSGIRWLVWPGEEKLIVRRIFFEIKGLSA